MKIIFDVLRIELYYQGDVVEFLFYAASFKLANVLIKYIVYS